MLLDLACGPGAQNANQQQARNQIEDQSQSDNQVVVKTDDSCDETDLTEKPKKIKKNLADRIEHHSKLKDQHDPDPNVPSRFKFDVRQSPDTSWYEAIVWGSVGGNDALKDLADILNDFNKKGCIMRVVFLPSAPPHLGPKDRVVGFEWTTCEDPKQPCPDGSCGPPCAEKSPRINGNSNGNSNSGTNTNSNTNSNSNRRP